jgi:hypothetical protein
MMPTRVTREGWTMAERKGQQKLEPGIYRKKLGVLGKPVRAPDFSYHPNDSLAQMIVDAWVDKDFRDQLLERQASKVTDEAARLAKTSLMGRGLYLQRAVVISEDEYNNGYQMGEPNEVVFVLPDHDLVEPRPGQSLLDTARLLMASTPNGI